MVKETVTFRNIPLSTPLVKGHAWKYVKDCLDTAWVSSAGAYVDRFESAVAHYVDRRYAIACVNGTAALHTALMVMDLKPGEEVIMPDLTFASPAFAIKYMGAFPVFIDVEKDHWQIDPQKLKDFLAAGCRRQGEKLVDRKTRRALKGILPVHLLGHPCDMDAVIKLAKKYKLWVIEDAAESFGAQYKSEKVASHADISCLSFNGNKIITCGGGGMILTDNKKWAQQARYLTTQAKDDPLEYIHHAVGYNYRLTNVAAALGLAQMEHLNEFINKKRAIARRYQQGLGGVEGLSVFKEAPWARSTFWLNTILVDQRNFGLTSRALLKVLAKRQVQARTLWHPLSGLAVFRDCYAHGIEESTRLYQQALSLPSSVHLTDQDQDHVIDLIQEAGQRR